MEEHQLLCARFQKEKARKEATVFTEAKAM
jgi:hypothetical protein